MTDSYQQAYYKANRDRIRAQQAAYRRTDKGKASKRRGELKHHYGITQEAYTAQFIKQDGRCAICHQPSLRKLHIDHDHQTGELRGLLCTNCNTVLGLMHDNPNLLARAADYLKEPSWT